jgi:elongation factor 1-alpha
MSVISDEILYRTDLGIAIAGSVDSGKCFAKDTRILMYDRTIKLVQDINVGDDILGDDFTVRTVKEIHYGISPLFKISYNNKNNHIIVNHNHILCLIREDGMFYEISVKELIQMRNINNYCIYTANLQNIYHFKIDIVTDGLYYGFEVDGNHKFLMEDYLVVHNSTFVGVMTNGILDNGNGSARTCVANHIHEISSGKTSSISTKTIINNTQEKAITLIDLCGHEKYFKTTTYGVSGHYPDYGIVVISSNKGILPMTKQHITLLMSLNVPIIIILTRYDITPINIYNQSKKMIDKYCKEIIKIPAEFINNPFDTQEMKEMKEKEDDKLDDLLKIFNNDNNSTKQIYVPVITVSNKTGYYIEFAKKFITRLKPRKLWTTFIDNNLTYENIQTKCTNRIIRGFMNHVDKKIFINDNNKQQSLFYIDGIFNPTGIGLVVSGITRGKRINCGDIMFIGPFNKEFKEVRIKSLNNNIKQKISYSDDHDRSTIAIATNDKEVCRKNLRKGMVLIHDKELLKTSLCFRFDAVVTIFNHAATLRNNYSPSMQIGNIRQTARMIIKPELNNGNDCIKLGDYATVTFKFILRPEFLDVNQVFIFRSGCVQGVGVIINLIPIHLDDDAKPDAIKIRKNRTRKNTLKIQNHA